MIEPIPCSSCGSVDEVMTVGELWAGTIPAGSDVEHAVGCINCDIWTPSYDTDEEAIEAWNRGVLK